MAASTPYPSSPSKAERTIALARVLLAIASLVAVWLDPPDAGSADHSLIALRLYVFYAVAVATIVWTQRERKWLPLASHVIDIGSISVLLTLAPSSPFFLYFLFCLFCAAIRWGWRGTMRTAGVLFVVYVALGIYMQLRSVDFDLNRFVVRMMNLVVTAGLLVYLGRYEERLRRDIERLAHWPAPVGVDQSAAIEQILRYSSGIIGAGRALVLWESEEEPWVRVASLSGGVCTHSRHAPGSLDPPVGSPYEHATVLCSGSLPNLTTVGVSTGPQQDPLADVRIHADLLARLEGDGLSSAPLHTERVSGRVFFTDIGAPAAEFLALTEVVALQFGASLDQLQATEQLKVVAGAEERIRLARDLHDGVLQSLTGVRLEIRALAGALDTDTTRDRLFAIERALAIEQRELRFFIGGLGPTPTRDGPPDGSLAGRLENLRERIALEWKAPVTIRVTRPPSAMSAHLEQAVPLMVHEAVVNALKHGEPSRVSVTVDGDGPEICIVVSDDGHGFPFHGRFDHIDLAAQHAGPASLINRVTSLGGRLLIESSETGSRVEMRLSL